MTRSVETLENYLDVAEPYDQFITVPIADLRAVLEQVQEDDDG